MTAKACPWSESHCRRACWWTPRYSAKLASDWYTATGAADNAVVPKDVTSAHSRRVSMYRNSLCRMAWNPGSRGAAGKPGLSWKCHPGAPASQVRAAQLELVRLAKYLAIPKEMPPAAPSGSRRSQNDSLGEGGIPGPISRRLLRRSVRGGLAARSSEISTNLLAGGLAMSSLHLLPLFMLGVAAMAVEVPLHDFEDVSVWRPNLDGGNPPQVSADTEYAREGTGMRLKYSDSTPNWGNISAPCSIPAGARALRLWVHKHAAAPGAAMHIWLFEADGDAWVQRVQLDGKDLAEATVGWHEARLPVSGFRFDGRGQGTRELTGQCYWCNFATSRYGRQDGVGGGGAQRRAAAGEADLGDRCRRAGDGAS